MPYVTVSIAGAANDARFGKCQFPIKSFIEKKGEGFEQESVLKQLFRFDTSNNFAESYHSDTAADNFEPVGEGGAYPTNGTQESYSQFLEAMTWKSRFVVTQEMVEDNKIGDMKKKANQLMTAYRRTREEFGRALYAGALLGTSVNYGGRLFKTTSADGVSLFSKVHPSILGKGNQSNLYSNGFTAENLGKIETEMQNRKGDNGELLSVCPDTIWIPNDAALKNDVFAAIGADKDPATSNNACNYHFGRWNVIVDPYLTKLLAQLGISSYKPWFLLDSQFLQDQDGAVFVDRKKLNIVSKIDDNNDNNLWDGRARFTGGFVDWRFISAGAVTGGTSL